MNVALFRTANITTKRRYITKKGDTHRPKTVEYINIILELLELKPQAKEYEELHDTLKNTFKGVEQAFVSDKWQIIGKERIINKVDAKILPDDIKKKYSTETKFWMSKFVKLKN